MNKEKLIQNNELYFAKVKENAIVPTKTDGNAGYDIYACFDEEYIIIQPNETKLIPTGIAMAFSEDWVAVVQERGSTGSKGMGKRCGIIDSNFRGEIFIGLTNHNNKPLVITKEKNTDVLTDDYIIYPYNKAIAQIIMLPVPKFDVKEITYDRLQEFKTDRMDGALGSSGK